jgi:hypothetical protein
MLALAASSLWWIVFRSAFCLSIAMNDTLDGPLKDLAMPFYAFLLLLLLMGATNQSIGSILAPISVDPLQFEVTALTQIYNACVSFPQLGPSHASMLGEEKMNVRNSDVVNSINMQ